MIRMNVDETTLETGEGLIDVVKKIFWYQIFYKDAIGNDIRLMAYQKAMYNPKYIDVFKLKKLKKLDLTYDLIKPLCDTAADTFLGRVPDIVTKAQKDEEKGKEDKEIENISNLTLKMKQNEFEEEISDVALEMGITGCGFLCLYNENGATFPKYRSLDPLYTNVVYDCSVAMKRLFAYNIYYDVDNLGKGRYVCIIYTKNKMYAFYTGQISVPAKMAFDIFPYNLFLIDGAQPTWQTNHDFKDIPIIEFINNKHSISDCKAVLILIALYSALMNNRFQNVDDIMNYLLFIKNARLGDEKQAKDALELIKNYRVLPLEGDNTDARFLSNPLNQTDIQTLANEIKRNIHSISGIPDFTSVEFTQNASDPVLKAKTKPLLDLCLKKEKWFNKGYYKVLDLTLDFVEKFDKDTYKEVGFDLSKVDLVYTHTLPSNDTDMVNNIVNLGNQKLLAPRIALQGLSFIPNVDDYLKEVKSWNELIDKLENLKNNNNSGNNQTNLERQNATPQTREQMDNKNNFIKGVSKDLTK